MATFSLVREENGKMVQVGESVEATLPLTEPLEFGPIPAGCHTAAIRITGVNGDYLGEYRSGCLAEGDMLNLNPRDGAPERSIWIDALSGL